MSKQKHWFLLWMIFCISMLFFVSPAYAAVTTPIDLGEVSQDLSGDGWDWNVSEKRLTLNGLHYEDVSEKNAAIILPEDSTIILQDSSVNKISTKCSYGIMCYGNLTIEGTGKLDIEIDIEIERNNSVSPDFYDIEEEFYVTGDYWDHSAGIALFGEGDCCINSGTIRISNAEMGIYYADNGFVGEYCQNGGTVVIDGLEKYRSKGIVGATYGFVTIKDGTLTINTSEYGIACLYFYQYGGDLNIHHVGENFVTRSGIYVGNSLQDKYKTAEVLAGNFYMDGGKIVTDGWANGISVCSSGKYMQYGGSVTTLNNTRSGICVTGGENSQGIVHITDGKLDAQGDTAAVMVIVPSGLVQGSQYIQIENAKGTSYLYASCEGSYYEEEQAGFAGLLQQGHSTESVEDTLAYPNKAEGVFAEKVTLECCYPNNISEKGFVKLYVNGTLLDIPPEQGKSYIDTNNRTMVPVRALATALGMDTKWDDASKRVSLSDNTGKQIILTLNETDYIVNGESKTMDTAAVSLPPGRIYVPLRFVAEAFGSRVSSAIDRSGALNVYIATAGNLL